MDEEFEILTNPTNTSCKLGEQLLADPDFSDVTLVCRDGQQIQAHRAVLCSSSRFLRLLLYDSLQQSTFLYLSSVEHRDLEALLNFIYLGSCTLLKKHKVQVTALAAALGVGGWPKEVFYNPLSGREEEQFQSKIEYSETPKDYIDSKFTQTKKNNTDRNKETPDEFQEIEHDINNVPLTDEGEGQIMLKIEENVKEYDHITSSEIENKLESQSKIIDLKFEAAEEKASVKGNVLVTRYPEIENLEPDANGKFACNMCNKIYVNKDKLKKHRLVRHYGFTFDCNECSSSFSSRDLLKGHIASAHAGVNLTCESCDQGFKGLRNLEYHKQRKVSCNKCDFTACPRKLIIHKNLNHHPNYIDGLFRCSKCEFTTKKSRTLIYHKSIHTSPTLFCEHCGYTTLKSYDLRIHTTNVHLKITYNCELCEYKSKRKLILSRHVMTAHEGFRFKCDECNYDGPSPTMLRTHKKSKHQMIKNHCDKCDSVYVTKECLRRHVLEKHEGRTYKCDSCDYVATQPHRITIHNETKHLKQFRFKCTMCDYKTGQKDLFRGHLKSRHNSTLDADKTFRNSRFNCCDCDYQTRKKRLLTGHMNNYHQSSPDACCQSQ